MEITEQIKERMKSASEMPPSQLVLTYRESLKYKENPLTNIFEGEILRRLWYSTPYSPPLSKEESQARRGEFQRTGA